MKPFKINTTPRDLDTLQARVGARIAAHLSEQAERTPQDVNERLRFAREQALQRARELRTAQAPAVVQSGGSATLALGGFGSQSSWWVRLASVMPLIVLVAGLVLIQQVHERAQISAAAEVDAQILSDDLPPAAYSDPGFAEFLKTPHE
ncbi:MAG TPA: DUF3619 family protein [Burkholderiaceae bacterium]|jgi:hypothetical protein